MRRSWPMVRFPVRLFAQKPIEHGKADDELYGAAVDRLLAALLKFVEGGVDDKSKLLWGEIVKFLSEYQKYHQGFPELETVIKFLAQKVMRPEERYRAPERLNIATSQLLGPPKI